MSNPLSIPFLKLPNFPGEDLPAYATAGSSGMDLRSVEDAVLGPGKRILLPCGFQMELPEGYEAQVRPRSGLAVKSGLTVINSPGTIDSDYRGEVKVALINLGEAPVSIARGDRIAQMIIARVEKARWEPSEMVGSTSRGGGGFGHTGK